MEPFPLNPPTSWMSEDLRPLIDESHDYYNDSATDDDDYSDDAN